MLLLSFAGLLVCRQGLNKNAFYRSGYQFFLLLFLFTAVYKLVYGSLFHMEVEPLRQRTPH
ncbi:MAG TPA: hypothetical protein DCD97_02830 [Firmicutes bacterium]|nr:hypothetical protein [Bacillota bacterium]